MKKLSKECRIAGVAAQECVISTRGALETSVSVYNRTVIAAWEVLGSEVAAYNEAVSLFQQWVEDATSEIQSYVDERSEKWQESDKASAYEDWKESLSVELSFCDWDMPELLSTDDLDDLDDSFSRISYELEG